MQDIFQYMHQNNDVNSGIDCQFLVFAAYEKAYAEFQKLK